MANDYPRSHRVADQIQQELSVLIRDAIKDPRMSTMLTITSVDVTRDLSMAKVFYTILDDTDRGDTQAALTSGAGYLRRQLGQSLSLRAVPQLIFRYDHSIEEGARMSALIADAIKSNTTEADDGSDSENPDDPAEDSNLPEHEL